MTKFTVKSYPQGQVWVSPLHRIARRPSDIVFVSQGGSILYGPDQLEAVKKATLEFSRITDSKASLITTFGYTSGAVCPVFRTISQQRY